ncbi:hypothetical protein [Heyndrickxia acidicola]|uniref:Uncharacterized protein n=1 Tax=Heyndrickxia acidicola TaxID=209389 RepID=A0ABU6MS66_9BACI|nr:hypothetical protein [Heyndrickxia acidicola]MED1205875.1 hypothetical protein [Heyndrickxia acidicola]
MKVKINHEDFTTINNENLIPYIQKHSGWGVIGKKIESAYDNLPWQHVHPDKDLFTNYNGVMNECVDGHAIHEAVCVADYSIWTEMKQFRPTEDLYKLIDYGMQTLKTGVHRDILHPIADVLNTIIINLFF